MLCRPSTGDRIPLLDRKYMYHDASHVCIQKDRNKLDYATDIFSSRHLLEYLIIVNNLIVLCLSTVSSLSLIYGTPIPTLSTV